jgi:hypothetical protein
MAQWKLTCPHAHGAARTQHALLSLAPTQRCKEAPTIRTGEKHVRVGHDCDAVFLGEVSFLFKKKKPGR